MMLGQFGKRKRLATFFKIGIFYNMSEGGRTVGSGKVASIIE